MRQPVPHACILVHPYLQLNGDVTGPVTLPSLDPSLPQRLRHSQHLPNAAETPSCRRARYTRANRIHGIRVSSISISHTEFCLPIGSRGSIPDRRSYRRAAIKSCAILCPGMRVNEPGKAWYAQQCTLAPMIPYLSA